MKRDAMKAEILIPLLNANEPEARLAGIHIADKQWVEKGTLLFTIETTKAALDIEAPVSGYIRLLASEQDILCVGERLALITATFDESMDIDQLKKPKGKPSRLRITKPARQLAENLGFELDQLPKNGLITETTVRKLAAELADSEPLVGNYDDDHILIYGGGGHAKAVIEMVQSMGNYEIAGILDDGLAVGDEVLGIPVLGGRSLIPSLFAGGLKQAANGVGGILDIRVRVKLFELLESYGFLFPKLIHPSAVVEKSSEIHDGVQVFANAYIGSSAYLHPRCMVNTNSVVSHDCEVGSYTHVAPGALLAGHVCVGERSLIGMGVTVAIGIRIGNGVRIGNSAIIYADIPDNAVVQAGKVWSGGN